MPLQKRKSKLGHKVNNKLSIYKVTDHNIRSSNIKNSKTMAKSLIRETKTGPTTTKVTSPSVSKGLSNSSKGINLTINRDIKAKDTCNVRKSVNLG